MLKSNSDLIEYDAFVDEMWLGEDHKYCAIALGGETGEVLNEVKKEIRERSNRTKEVLLEIGDTLFYLTRLAHFYGRSLNDVIKMNVEKLEARKVATGRP